MKNSNNIYESLFWKDKTTGAISYPSQNSNTIIIYIPRLYTPLSCSTPDAIHVWASNQDNDRLISNPLTNSNNGWKTHSKKPNRLYDYRKRRWPCTTITNTIRPRLSNPATKFSSTPTISEPPDLPKNSTTKNTVRIR